MLEFFRRYQTYFFAVITAVIVVSFSFFGTYNSLPPAAMQEQTAFVAIDGNEIKRSELDAIALFISSDNEDKILFGGMWGPNFLNNGVIRKDFLQSGLGELLIGAYPEAVSGDLTTRAMKEKSYLPYKHPQAKFVSAEGVWAYFAPGIQEQFEVIRTARNPLSLNALHARAQLFLLERQFPAPLLRQVLQYQQKQYSWLAPDGNLDRMDLSLFGYHTLEDWFGGRFIKLVSQFIINSSIVAQEKGYRVLPGEAWADLLKNAQESYAQQKNNPQLGVANVGEYVREQLRRLGLDQTQAVKIWEKVLLFRRLFHDVGNAVLTDALLYEQFYNYASETVEGDRYQLPSTLRFADYGQLQKFQVYLDAVAKRSGGQEEFTPPTVFQPVEKVKSSMPQLIQKRYLLQIAEVSKKDLEKNVNLKETWRWEVSELGWSALQKQFPDILGLKTAVNSTERLAVLDALDDATRMRVDGFARAQIVDTHPEWLDEALGAAIPERKIVGVRIKGGKPLFALEDRTELMKLLDRASLGEKEARLDRFTGDGKTFYRIQVLDYDRKETILTFAEANTEGILDPLVEKEYAKRFPDKKLESAAGNTAASSYFLPYMEQLKKQLALDENSAGVVSDSETSKGSTETLPLREPLENQWKLVKSSYAVSRSHGGSVVNLDQLLLLKAGDWTAVTIASNGDHSFLHVKQKRSGGESLVAEKVLEAHRVLSDAAQRSYGSRLLQEFKEKKVISLDYLEPTPRSDEDAFLDPRSS